MDVVTLRSLVGVPYRMTATEHFEILHEAGDDRAARTGETLERAYQCFYEVFSQAGFELSRPEEALVWICFPQQSDFDKYARTTEGMDLSWLDGYYSTLTNCVAIVQPSPGLCEWQEKEMRPGDDVRLTLTVTRQSERILPMSAAGQPLEVARLTHELAHQLAFNSGLQKRGVMYPLWVSEGLATYFELDGSAGTGFQAWNSVRGRCLVEAYKRGELIPLGRFVVQTKVPPDAHLSRQCYAQAWAFFQFILMEYPAQLRCYLEHLAERPPGWRFTHVMTKEFTAAFGSLSELEFSWRLFLVRQVQQISASRSAVSSNGLPTQEP
jgi:hypothetical protein